MEKHLDFMLEWTEKLEQEAIKISRSKFSKNKNDIRCSYFYLTHQLAYTYYLKFILLFISESVNNKNISLDEKTNSKHINKVLRITKDNDIDMKNEYFRSLNRNLIIDSWSVFEFCLTTFCEGICSDSELKNNTKKLHLTHISINHKIKFIFEKIEASNKYKRNIKKDKEFLIFFGKLRNTMHTNFIYHRYKETDNKIYEYKFKDTLFVFIDKQTINDNNTEKFSPKLHFGLIEELKLIWNELIHSIEYSELIEHPDNERQP